MSKDKAAKTWHGPRKSSYKGAGDYHVSHEDLGMGNYYAVGIKKPVGKVIRAMGSNPASKDQLKTPPRKLA